MTSHRLRTVAYLCLALMAAPVLIAPAASATVVQAGGRGIELIADLEDGEIGGGCRTYTSPLLSSGPYKWAVRPSKYYNARGFFTDGCGGKGCDDRVDGWFEDSRGRTYNFYVYEVLIAGTDCRVSCGTEASGGMQKWDVRGLLHTDRHEDFAKVVCGNKADGTWLFEGNLYYHWRNLDGLPSPIPDETPYVGPETVGELAEGARELAAETAGDLAESIRPDGPIVLQWSP